MGKNQISHVVNEVIANSLIMLAAIVLALNYHLFIIGNHFAPAGLNGIATMIQYKTGFSIGYISLLINVPLCFLSYFFISKKYALRTLCFCLSYAFFYLFLQNFDLSSFTYDSSGYNSIFPVILSGLISGGVYALCFQKNASTGGTDIISRYISIRKPQMNFFFVTFTLNAIVAFISFFVYTTIGDSGEIVYNYEPVCLCVTYCFISSFFGNYLIMGTKHAVRFTIITRFPQELSAAIADNLHHGSTQLPAIGSYTGQDLTVLLCVINPHQIADLKVLLKDFSDTFAFFDTVDETFGNFKRIK